MKAWSAALAGEIAGRPRVATRFFFGFTAVYRRDRIFALLPRTRGMESANSLGFKVEDPTPSVRARIEKDPRVGSTQMQKARWFTYKLSSDADLHDALEWLNRAYRAAGKSKKNR